MYLNGNNLALWNNNAVFWYSRIISQGSFCSFWIINLFTYLHPSPPRYIPSHFLHYSITFSLPKHYWNRWVWIIIRRESSLSLEQTSTEAIQKYGFGRPLQEEGSTTTKKLKLSKEQLDVLEESFEMNSYPKLVWLIILFTYCFVISGVWLTVLFTYCFVILGVWLR